MKFPIVINKFRLGDRSERIAALADEWGCSVTVATARLLDAGLAAVDRDQRMTPDAIRAAFGKVYVPSPSMFYSKEAIAEAAKLVPGSTVNPETGDLQGMIDANDAVDALLGPWTPIEPNAPAFPDWPGKRMFDEAARHAVGQSLSVPGRLLTGDEVQAAILNGMPPARVDQSWWSSQPSQSDIDQAAFRAQYLGEFGAPI